MRDLKHDGRDLHFNWVVNNKKTRDLKQICRLLSMMVVMFMFNIDGSQITESPCRNLI